MNEWIHHLIDCGMSALHFAMGHVQFPAVWYVIRISNRNTEHSEMQARTILLGKNKSYRICTGNSNYTFRHDICIREVHSMAADSRAKEALLNCCLRPLICCNVQKQIKIT
jgi:hypothetical protein